LTPPGTARKARENLGNVAPEQAGLAPTPVSFIMVVPQAVPPDLYFTGVMDEPWSCIAKQFWNVSRRFHA